MALDVAQPSFVVEKCGHIRGILRCGDCKFGIISLRSDSLVKPTIIVVYDRFSAFEIVEPYFNDTSTKSRNHLSIVHMIRSVVAFLSAFPMSF
jgi:hypothetical protein